MTGFNAQVGDGVYRIQFETDSSKYYRVVKEVIRAFVDQDNANEVAVSKMEKGALVEECSVCCEDLGMEVEAND